MMNKGGRGQQNRVSRVNWTSGMQGNKDNVERMAVYPRSRNRWGINGEKERERTEWDSEQKGSNWKQCWRKQYPAKATKTECGVWEQSHQHRRGLNTRGADSHLYLQNDLPCACLMATPGSFVPKRMANSWILLLNSSDHRGLAWPVLKHVGLGWKLWFIAPSWPLPSPKALMKWYPSFDLIPEFLPKHRIY